MSLLDFLAGFATDYGLFLAKVLTVVGSLVFLVSVIVNAGQRLKKLEKMGHIEVTSLNDQFDDMAFTLQGGILPLSVQEALDKERKKNLKAREKADKKKKPDSDGQYQPERPRVFVVDFDGDIRASAADGLAKKITAILTQALPADEVVVRLESTGGMVHAYGLASSQLQRVRDKGISLTVCVDKVAASGGYMMACLANKLVAAPFAVIGSIGVIAQLPNVHRLLKKHDIDFEMLSAGEYKRTLTVFGENTDKGRHKFQQEIEETHQLFKQFVNTQRPSLDMAVVATGEVWFGSKARELGLVDELGTSDDYLFARSRQADVFEVDWVEKQSLSERFGLAAESAGERVLMRWLGLLQNRKTLLH